MNQFNFVDWATIAGGFAGLLSFIYVLWEKLTNTPKLVTKLRKASFILRHDMSHEADKYNIDAQVSLEIGNVGNESTTITEVKLLLSDGMLLPSKQLSNEYRMCFLVDDFETRLCDKGIAFVEHLRFFASDCDDNFGDTVKGNVILTLLGGDEIKQPVEFNIERSKL